MATSSDFLRAHLHQLVRAADGRDLAAILDILSGSADFIPVQRKATLAAFPLFSLPVELLELVTLFFKPAEAARLLAVNKVFHEVFSRQLWRHPILGQYDLSRFTSSLWQRYGHLVQSMWLACTPDCDFTSFHLPNITHLKLSGAIGSSILYVDMPRLRHLSVRIETGENYSRDDLNRFCSWVNNAHQRGQRVVVEWDIFIRNNTPDRVLGAMVESIDWSCANLHSFSVRVYDRDVELAGTVPEQIASQMTSLDIGRYMVKPHIASGYFFADSDIGYPQLRTLKLNMGYPQGNDYDFSNFTPQRLPGLTKLEIFGDSDRGEAARSLPRIFAHTWPSVTRLTLCDYTRSDTFELALSRTPNLQFLSIQEHHFALKMSVLAQSAPQLKRLEIFDIQHEFDSVVQLSEPLPTLHNVKELLMTGNERNAVCVTRSTMRLLTQCLPSLEDLQLEWFTVTDGVLDEIHDYGCLASLRSLSVTVDDYHFSSSDVEKFVSIAPKLRALTLLCGSRSIQAKMQEQLPLIHVKLH